MNCKRSNCGHAINRHYGDEEQFCMMCSCVGYLSDFWEGSVIEPGKWYHEHTKEQLAGEIVRRGLRDSEVFTMSKDALVSALEIDDAKYGHNQGPRKIVEHPNIPEGKGFVQEQPVTPGGTVPVEHGEHGSHEMPAMWETADVVDDKAKYLRACCETPFNSEHRSGCTVPTERIPEPDCTDDCDRHETCRNRQPQAGLNTAGNPTKVVQKWADPAMFTAEPINADEGPKVHLLSMTADPLGTIAAACKMYKGEVVRDLSSVTDAEREEYLGEILKTKLQAPFEFVKFHFMIEGVTRAFTHQMVRQRTAVYAQESLRFAVKEDMPVGLPPSLAGTTGVWREHEEAAMQKTPGYEPGHYLIDDEVAEAMVRESEAERQRWAWDQAVDGISSKYQYLVNSGVPAEDARGLLPHNTLTRLHYSTDLRALLDHAGNRLCTQAQFEWRLVFSRIAEAIRNAARPSTAPLSRMHWGNIAPSVVERYPVYMADKIADLFRPVCYATGKCEFKANFDRKCSIRNRVDANADINRPSSEWGQEHDVVDGSALVCGVGPTSVVRDEGGRPVFIGAIKPAEWLLNPGAAR